MAFTAFLDANVLYPVGLRDSLLWIAHAGVYSPLWSSDVLDEMRRNILKRRPEVGTRELDQMIADMREAFPEAEVTGYKDLEASMTNQPDDRHVLAAAVSAKAGVLVSENTKHFPPEACEPYEIDVQSADTFLLHALSHASFQVHEALSRQAAIKRRPPMSVADVLQHLEAIAPTFVSEARIDWEIIPAG